MSNQKICTYLALQGLRASKYNMGELEELHWLDIINRCKDNEELLIELENHFNVLRMKYEETN